MKALLVTYSDTILLEKMQSISQPGKPLEVSHMELCQLTNIPLTTLQYSLRRLAKAQLIKPIHTPGKRTAYEVAQTNVQPA